MENRGLNLVNPDKDRERGENDVRYRLYDHPTKGSTVICVQWFDYFDYDASRFLTYEAYVDEKDADDALLVLAAKITELHRRFRRAWAT